MKKTKKADSQKKDPGVSRGRGRPFASINWDQFEALCAMQCTEEEICSVLKIAPNTLNAICKRERGAGFIECKKPHAAGGKASIRRHLFQQMQNGSFPATKFLAQNIINYSDKVEQTVEHSGEVANNGYTREQMEILANDPEALELTRKIAEKLYIDPDEEGTDEG